MRISALRYMFMRGVLGGIWVFGLIMLLSGLAGWNTGVFGKIVSSGAINQPASTAMFYLTSIVMLALAGGLAGGVIGAITGLYTERYVKRHYARIYDASDYASNLGWRTGLLSATLSVAALFVMMLSIFASLPGVALVILTGVFGGLAGRGYAHHDMTQRREKKHRYNAHDDELDNARNRLESDETEIDAASFYDEPLLEHQHI